MILEVLVDLTLPKIMGDIVDKSIYAPTLEEGLAVVAQNGWIMLLLVITNLPHISLSKYLVLGKLAVLLFSAERKKVSNFRKRLKKSETVRLQMPKI